MPACKTGEINKNNTIIDENGFSSLDIDEKKPSVRDIMQGMIANFQENNNKGEGILLVTGKCKPIIYKGCSAATGELKRPEKNTYIYIDKIAQSTTSKSMFGHVTHLEYPDGVKEYNINGWISLASLFITPVSYNKHKLNNYNF